MSGGHLTDHGTYSLYALEEWAMGVERENILLASMLRDLRVLLDRYDYYLSDDIGEESIEKSWGTFRDKWLNIDSDSITELLFEKCLEMVDGAIKGYKDGN